ncbi:MAG: LamG-like jellyroll fold domain-containing protein [Verrucomicrobiota bacterium]
MRYAIFSDIHANRQAWESVLLDIQGIGVDALACLGDVVGYGPKPQAVLDGIRGVTSNFVLGNHDAAVCGRMDASIFNEQAREVIEWTRERIDEEGLQFLSEVPFAIESEDVFFVHAEVPEPGRFGYVTDTEMARESFEATEARLIFLGHTHEPMVYVEEAGEVHCHGPADFHTRAGQRYLVNVGSVGEPRDPDDLRASYVLYDSESGLVRFRRVEFDFDGYRVDLRREKLGIDPYFLRVVDFDGAEHERTLLVPSAPALKRAPIVPVIPVKAGPPRKLVGAGSEVLGPAVPRSSSSAAPLESGGQVRRAGAISDKGVHGRGEAVKKRSISMGLVSTVLGVTLLLAAIPVAWRLVGQAESGLQTPVMVSGKVSEGEAPLVETVNEAVADSGGESFSREGSLGDDLLSYWSFDGDFRPTAGSMPIVGVSGGKKGWSADLFGGKAIRLAGNLQLVLGSKDLYSIKDGGALSVSVWVLPRTKGTKRHQVIGNGGEDSKQAGWGLFEQSKKYQMKVVTGRQKGGVRILEVEAPRKWIHLAAVIDMGEGVATFYKDGEAVVEKDVSGMGRGVGSSRSLIVGKNGKSKQTAPFAGDLDDLAIWRRALSPEEVFAIFDQGKRLKNPLGKLLPSSE